MRTLLAIGRKELRQIARDRRSLFILLFVPAFFLLLYGYALNFDIRDISLAVEDNDRSSESRALVSAFVNSGYFRLVEFVESNADLRRLIDRNDARATLVIPSEFGRDVIRGRPVGVQVIIDGENATVKKLFREPGGMVRLQPANPALSPIRLPEDRVRVQGIVVGVIRKY